MKIYTLILLILLCAGISFGQETRTWKTFSAPGGEWSILAPGTMTPDEEAVKPKSKKGSYSYRDSNGFFAVIYRDLPRVPKKLKAYYDQTRDGAVQGFSGRLLGEGDFTNGSITGREIRIEGETRVERARMFFHGKRFYVVLAVLPGNEINSEAVTAYLNSFTVK